MVTKSKNLYQKVFKFRCCAVCVLNLHESERTKPDSWRPFAWMPILLAELGWSTKAWPTNFIAWDEQTQDATNLHWAVLYWKVEDILGC